ncbi:MAG: hypothetical protein ACQEVA_21175, partial [Myxococcota bacterium]
GATIVHVMSGTHPAQLDMTRNRLHFEPVIDAPGWLEAFLGRLLEPAAEDRFDDADEALSFFRELRDKGDAVSEQSPELPASNDRGWLQSHRQRVLVDDRATNQVVYRIECRDGTTLEDSVERKPGQVEWVVQPDSATLEFTSGKASTPVTARGLAAVLAVLLLLALPLPITVRLGAASLGIFSLTGYYIWRTEEKTRRIELYSDRIELSGAFPDENYHRYPGQARFEARGSDVFLVSDNNPTVLLAGGLGEERARWLAASLERVRSALIDEHAIEFESLDPSTGDDQDEVVEVGVSRAGLE